MPPSAEAEVPLPAVAAAREAVPPRTPAGSCYLGVLLASESVELVAEVAGRVREVAVRPGDAVAAGALLATLTADGLRDELAIEQANLAGARSDLAAAEVEVRRAGEEHRRRLALAELVSRETIAAAAYELEAATRRLRRLCYRIAGRPRQNSPQNRSRQRLFQFEESVELTRIGVGSRQSSLPGSRGGQHLSGERSGGRYRCPIPPREACARDPSESSPAGSACPATSRSPTVR
jgi:pyruvate/2-oxoglutarate dehydrogenase complex dihydrolipoamide acyltransferase (E2) component